MKKLLLNFIFVGLANAAGINDTGNITGGVVTLTSTQRTSTATATALTASGTITANALTVNATGGASTTITSLGIMTFSWVETLAGPWALVMTTPVILLSIFQHSRELKDKLRSVATATLSQLLRKRGYNNVSIDGLTATHPGTKVVGRARTLRYIANREDLFESHGGGYNAQKRLFDSLKTDDIVVIEARGDGRSGTLGDVLALRARHLGAAALVTDGGIRDLAAVTEIGVPAYHSGGHPAVLGRLHVPWDADLTVTCGGCAVQPGDVIVGDGDGLIVIPPKLVEEVVNDAIAQELEEVFIAEIVDSGEAVKDTFPLNAVWREKFNAWKAARS